MPAVPMTVLGEQLELARTLQSLQVCRGIAALVVVLFHLSGAVAAQKYFGEPWFIPLFSWGGSAGVCFFFVLSGFIITSIHWSDVGNPPRFPGYVYKRITRIYPIYWLLFFVALLGAVVVPGASDGGVSMDAVTLLKSMALLPQDPGIVGGTGAPVLIVAWSLQYEMVFYAFFGLLILNRVAGFAFAAGAFASAFAGHVLGWRLFLYFMNPVFFILFGFGLLIGLAAKAKLWTSYGRVAVLLGAAGLVATAVIANRTVTTGLELIYGLGAGLLIFGLATMEGKRRFQIWKGWLLLGESSYVLYLIHFPIISVACKAAIAAGLAGFLGATITWVVTLAICVGAAVLVHIMAEKPMMTTARAVWGRTSFARPSSELRPQR